VTTSAGEEKKLVGRSGQASEGDVKRFEKKRKGWTGPRKIPLHAHNKEEKGTPQKRVHPGTGTRRGEERKGGGVFGEGSHLVWDPTPPAWGQKARPGAQEKGIRIRKRPHRKESGKAPNFLSDLFGEGRGGVRRGGWTGAI